MVGKMVVTRKFKVLAGYTFAYLLLAGMMMIGDAISTDYVLEHSGNTYEINVKVDASNLSTLLAGISGTLAIFTGLFLLSLTACLSEGKYRKFLEIENRWDEVFIRMLGAVAIWNLFMVFGALINNGGMIFFGFSWMYSTLNLLGFHTENEQMAAFVFFPLVALVILLVPMYLLFSRVVSRAKRSVGENAI